MSELASGKADTLTTAYQTALENDKKAADEAAAKDLEQFADYVVGLYKTKDGYQKLIEKLQKSNDPNKAAKIGLARKAMNALEDEVATSSGSGSSYRSSGYSYGGGGYSSGGGYDDSGDTTTPTTTIDPTETMNAYRKANYQNRTSSSSTNNKKNKYPTYYTGTKISYGR